MEQLVYQLSLLDQTNEYVLFLRTANFEFVKIGNTQFKYKKVLADIPWYGWKEQVLLPGIIKKEKIDLMHWPHWNFPILYRGDFVVTIHDLIMYHYPRAEATTLGPVYYWLKENISRFVTGQIIRCAKHILATSEFTKKDIQKEFKIDTAKITVTYQAAALPSVKKNNESIELKGVVKPYLLYVGAVYPHKNLDRLIEAWPLVQAQTKNAYQLVLVGRENFFYKKLKAKVQNAGLTDIMFTGFVQDVELSQWYANAKLFVFPSLYEGFGLPPLEAWAENVPVAAARASCLPEILGAGAVYFDPESVEDMAKALVSGLTDGGLRLKVQSNASFEQKKYSWDSCAQKTLAVYQNVL
ncbi:MAG: glycosyltransferase family 4 protein [Candidatus Magasanikbacteria bacterium]|nr:glycosyltransferase family 4 protein [Candidatus Magasanikbacteria bacterium]